VSQMKARLKNLENAFPADFIDLFTPIKYALCVKDSEANRNLILRLFYRLASSLGIIENTIASDKNSLIKVNQKIDSIVNDEGDIDCSSGSDENLSSLNFYISALRNTNPFHQFIEIYHIFESLFYLYFCDYVEGLEKCKRKEKFDLIRDHIKEVQLLGLVCKDSLQNNQKFINEMKQNLLKANLQKVTGKEIKKIKNWPENEPEKFAKHLSSFIYALRNAIVHSKEGYKYIEKIEMEPDLLSNLVQLNNDLLKIGQDVLENKIIRM